MLTTSARASSSSLVTSVAPTSAARAAVRFWLQAITSISNARPTLATREPSPPSPMTPRVLPFRPSPQLTCHRPSRVARSSIGMRRASARMRPHARSADGQRLDSRPGSRHGSCSAPSLLLSGATPLKLPRHSFAAERGDPPQTPPGSANVVAPAVLARELVQARLEAAVEALVDGGEHVVELLRAAGADDRRRDDRVLQHPGDGHLDPRHSGLRSERAEGLPGPELALVPVTLPVARAGRRVREARARHRAGLAAMLAGEEAASHRVVSDHAQSLLRAEREQLALDLAVEKVVAGLHAGEARQTANLASPQRARHLIREVVRAADVTRLARAHHVVERAQALVDRRRRIGMVELVEVHVVGAKPAQRALDRVEDVLAREPLVPGAGAHGAEALGGDDEVPTASLEPATEDLLRAPNRIEGAADGVHVRGVEKRDTARGGPIENGHPAGLVALQAEWPGGQAELGDGQPRAAETDVSHRDPLAGMNPGTIPPREDSVRLRTGVRSGPRPIEEGGYLWLGAHHWRQRLPSS